MSAPTPDAATQPSSQPAANPPGLPSLDDKTLQFIEQFALVWASTGNPRMEGRIVGLLMIVDVPYLSSTQIASLLHASAGAISVSTRQLVDIGFIKRHVVPGDRNHYFRVEDDIWGSFLSGERNFLSRLQDVIDTGFAVVPSDDMHGPHRRLTYARLYMTWLTGYNRKMLADWQAYRDEALRGAPLEDT